jgi:hypothetical protein
MKLLSTLARCIPIFGFVLLALAVFSPPLRGASVVKLPPDGPTKDEGYSKPPPVRFSARGGWIFLKLPRLNGEPLMASPNGVVLLRDSVTQKFTRWNAGATLPLGPESNKDRAFWIGDKRTENGTHRFDNYAMNSAGAIALAYTYSAVSASINVWDQYVRVWSRGDQVPKLAHGYLKTDIPFDGAAGPTYMTTYQRQSELLGVNTEMLPPRDHVIGSFSRLRTPPNDPIPYFSNHYLEAKRPPYAVANQSTWYGLDYLLVAVNNRGQHIAKRAPGGGATTSGSVQYTDVTFTPVYLSDSGIALGRNGLTSFAAFGPSEGAQVMYSIADGYLPLPSGGRVTWVDELGRPNGFATNGIPVVWTPKKGPDGIASPLLGYDRENYVPLPMPEGWATNPVHMIPPNTIKHQLGVMSQGKQTQPFLAIPGGLYVDANRDGKIEFDGSDDTAAANPYRFWSNDDDDDGGDINGDDTPGSSTPDGRQGKVQGTRDLVDFFPVFLDIKQLLTVLPPSASIRYKLKNADDGLRLVYTDLSRADAFKYLKDFAAGNSLKAADAHWVTATGYELDATWLGQVKNADKGVILVEGRNATDKPLVLSVEKADGTVIAEVKLELKIVPVETMFRHLNLHDRNLAGLVGAMPGGAAQPEAMGDPTGFPDDPNSDSRWLIFVHGFNVSGRGGRGWNAEMFKRCYWSGNKSRFVGVSWFGNPDQVLGAVSDYHLAMRNAMVTAPVLAQEINALTGAAATKTLFAHSLGCGVISSAIADHGMNIGRVCFVDAALALESFDGRDPNAFSSENDGMTPTAWKAYDPKFYAANWSNLFPTTDARARLTWTNRFTRTDNGQKDASSYVYNFYSSTEDVLGATTEDIPTWVLGQPDAPFLHGTFGWVFQEKGKGNRKYYALGITHLGSLYGGWGFNLTDPLLNGDPKWYFPSTNQVGTPSRRAKTPGEIGSPVIWLDALKRTPFFKTGWGRWNANSPEQEIIDTNYFEGPTWAYDLYRGTTGSGIAAVAANRAQFLAEAIPSLTWCMGSHESTGLQSGRNFNLPSLIDQANWPRDKINNVSEWRHSDMREVAYLYQYGVFDKIIAISKP